LKVSAIETLALAAMAVALGLWMRSRVRFVERFNIPPSIAGGLFFAILFFILHARGYVIEFDAALREPLMLACFTIIGFNSSVRVLRRGGKLILLLIGLATLGGVLQNVVGCSLARLFGLSVFVGPLAGSVSLLGGPATSQAFGATFEELGVQGAATIALASATFGIAVSGLIAGALGGWLLRTRGVGPLTPNASGDTMEALPEKPAAALPLDLARHTLWIVVVLGVGAVVSRFISKAGLVVPGYIGAMIVAALVRNADDKWKFVRLSESTLEQIFAALLPLFIGLAMVTLKLWELERLAVPLIMILCVQVVITTAYCGACYRLLGRDYDGAVTTAGFCGFMLGITPNAMASMEEIARKYGPAPRAFLAVPVVGGFLMDFTNSLLITLTIGVLRLIH
jgi:ESS family glutamate:Na+ symporter